MRRLLAAAAAATAGLVLASCSSSSSSAASASSSSASSSSAAISGKLTVFAAASLTEAFGTLGKRFEKAHPGVHVTFDFDASSTLAEQITQGAPADVFASASTTNMQQVTKAKDAAGPTNLVKNTLEIAVPPKNPGSVHSVKDLAKSGVKVAVCQPQVPCGATAQQLFKNAKLTVHPVTEEPDVKSTLSKVELGEVDAGVVYVTDVRAADSKVKGVTIPKSVNATTTYPIATLSHAKNPAAAKAFVQLVLSPAGRKVLTADGFLAP